LDKFKDAFAKAGVNISALRDVNLTEEVTLPDGSKGQRWQLPEKDGGLPALAKAVLTAPPEKQATIATSISQLPPGEVAGLDAGQLAALGLDSPTGLWADWKRAADTQAAVASIPDNQPARIFNTLGLGDFDKANAIIADAILSEAITGQRHPVLDLDVNKNGKLDAADMPALKERAKGSGMPSLEQTITTGNVPKANIPNPNRPIDYGGAEQQSVFNDMKNVLADGFFTQEEADALPWSEEKMVSVLNSLPKQNGRYIGQGVYIANTLQGAIERKKKAKIDANAAAAAAAAANEERLRADEERRRAEEERKAEGRAKERKIDTAIKVLAPALPTVGEAKGISAASKQATKEVKRYFGGR
jgi:hypothetical protein